ncbi:MAG: hypothetical protein ACK5O7_06925 [Holosporales bacterium]
MIIDLSASPPTRLPLIVFFHLSQLLPSFATEIKVEIRQEVPNEKARTFCIIREPDFTPAGIPMYAFPMRSKSTNEWQIKGGVEGALLKLCLNLAPFMLPCALKEGQRSPAYELNIDALASDVRRDPFRATKIIEVELQWQASLHQHFHGSNSDGAQLQEFFSHLPNVQRIILELPYLEPLVKPLKLALKTVYQGAPPDPDSFFICSPDIKRAAPPK